VAVGGLEMQKQRQQNKATVNECILMLELSYMKMENVT